MCLAVIFPVVCAVQRDRLTAGLAAAMYYLGCGCPMLIVARNYLGAMEGTAVGISLWTGAAALLATPWGWAWSPHRRAGAAKMCLAILITIVPPLGIIGFGSPAMVAGLLFPGSGWIGLSATIVLPSMLFVSSKAAVAVAAPAALILNATFVPPQPLPGWQAVNTSFGSTDNGFARLSWVRARAEQSAATVLIFPESVIPDWTAATELFWSETEHVLQEQNRVVLVGVTRPTAGGYRNSILIRGPEVDAFDQRIPVPMGMWRPLARGSFQLNLGTPGTLVIRNHRAAILICYEQLIAWPWIASLVERPAVIVALANDYWSGGTSLQRYHPIAAYAWARLFTLPLLEATNSLDSPPQALIR